MEGLSQSLQVTRLAVTSGVTAYLKAPVGGRMENLRTEVKVHVFRQSVDLLGFEWF